MDAPRPSLSLIGKLQTLTSLTDEERNAVSGLPMTIRNLKAEADIVREQDRPSQSCLVLSGMLCRYRILPSGKRQIFSFHIAGDIPDLHDSHAPTLACNLHALWATRQGHPELTSTSPA